MHFQRIGIDFPMQLSLSATTRIGLRIALPALIILIATIATVIVSIERMADEVSRVEDSLKLHSADAATQSVLRRLGQTHRDYAEWDDAVRQLYGEIDPIFFAENYNSATEINTLFDTAYVLDENGRALAGVRLGKRTNLAAQEAFGPEIETLLSGLAADGQTYDMRTGFVDGAWGPAAVAVGPIVPASVDFQARPERSRYLVVAQALDDAAINVIAEEFVIDGLRFANPGEITARNLDLLDPAGRAIASLTWPPVEMGAQAFAEVSPSVFVMLALIGITIVVLIIVAFHGIREIKTGEDQARYAAAHDSLSGLPNRVTLIRRLVDAVAEARRDENRGVLIYLDLDGFKEVNDSFGHNIGDRLLRNVSAGFHAICGDRLIARIGGDEFAIILFDENPIQAATDLGRQLIRYLAQPVDIDGRVIGVGASIGVAPIDGTVSSAEEALRRADVAMYEAKQQGRNRVFVYEATIDIARHQRLEIAADLREALRSDRLTMAYQPIFDAATREIVGAEALLRWPRPGEPEIPPSVFVPIAEETGLIDELGAWTLRRACSDALAWPNVRIAVNLSPAQFRNPSFDDTLTTILSEVALEPDRLELEVTETYLVANPDQARRSINAIRALGVSVALDDFGTGYSSIGYLRSFTFDKLKLDRSLVTGIATDHRAQRFIQATIALAEALDLEVVAEGVENEEEALLLHLAGCREFQGFHLGKPCNAEEFTSRLRSEGRGDIASARA